MNDKNLQYFLAVSEEHSISTAARKLFIAQPSLSQAIKRLEDSVGEPLFKRTGSGLQLTNIGEQFYAAAVQTEKIWQNFSMNLTAPDDLKEGTLSFGIVFQLGLKILPQILIQFNQKFPKINCNVYDKNHIELEKSLLSGELDLAVTHIQNHQERPSLSYDCFLRDPFVVIASLKRDCSRFLTDSPNGPMVHLEQLEEEKFIYPKKENQSRHIIDSVLAKCNILYPKEYLVNNQYETIQALVEADLGIGILPKSYLSPSMALQVFHIPEEYEAYWDFCIVIRKYYSLNYIEDCFVRIAKESCLGL